MSSSNLVINQRIAVTGATGFVGAELLKKLEDCNLVVMGRNPPSNYTDEFHKLEIDGGSDFSTALEGVVTVVHCAARVHVMKDDALDPLAEFLGVNVKGTLKLAAQAAQSGVKRFVYISSVKVCGDSTSSTNPFVEKNSSVSCDPYVISKMEAENALRKLANKTGMEVVIIRPPLVYGAGVKANFFNLLKLSDTNVPLPFARINNKRSMIYVGNLVDFIIKCIEHPNAANEIFLVSDGHDLSLRSLIICIRKSMNRKVLLFPVPVAFFKLVGKLLRKNQALDLLVGDFQVDTTKAKKMLGWSPPFTVMQGISQTVSSFLNRKG